MKIAEENSICGFNCISALPIYRGLLSPNDSHKTSIARPLGRAMLSFVSSSSERNCTIEFIMLCAASCYIVPRYIGSLWYRGSQFAIQLKYVNEKRIRTLTRLAVFTYFWNGGSNEMIYHLKQFKNSGWWLRVIYSEWGILRLLVKKDRAQISVPHHFHLSTNAVLVIRSNYYDHHKI